jgi:hypothetical protein
MPGRRLTIYEITLSAAPSPTWRAAFLRPPPRLTQTTTTPLLERVELVGDRIHFRTTPPRLHYCLRWIDRRIAYANSVVEE